MSWLRAITYVAAGTAGIFAIIFPVAGPILAPLASGLAGWATKHPSDSKPQAPVAKGNPV
jgi:hypothetical protein